MTRRPNPRTVCCAATNRMVETLSFASTVPQISSETRCVVVDVLLTLYSLMPGKNTNVIELYNLVLKVGENQQTWYNSGIGTYARPSWKSLKYYTQVIHHKIDLMIAWCVDQCRVTDRALNSPFLCTGTSKRRCKALIAGSPITMSQEIASFCLVCQHNCYLITSVLIMRNTKAFLAAHFRSAHCQR